jgi:hypothetical protein
MQRWHMGRRGYQETPMHTLAVCDVISAALYVAIRLTTRFYFPPET